MRRRQRSIHWSCSSTATAIKARTTAGRCARAPESGPSPPTRSDIPRSCWRHSVRPTTAGAVLPGSPAIQPAVRSTLCSRCSTTSSAATASIPIAATSPACRAAAGHAARALASAGAVRRGDPGLSRRRARAHPEVPPRENGVGVVAGIESHPALVLPRHRRSGGAHLTHPRSRCRAAASGGSPRLTEYPGVKHDAWVKAYAEPAIVDWLFGHHR